MLLTIDLTVTTTATGATKDVILDRIQQLKKILTMGPSLVAPSRAVAAARASLYCLLGSWQSVEDRALRKLILLEVVDYLNARPPQGTKPPAWLKCVPKIAKQVELILYAIAPSAELYGDVNTVKARLKEGIMRLLIAPMKSNTPAGLAYKAKAAAGHTRTQGTTTSQLIPSTHQPVVHVQQQAVASSGSSSVVSWQGESHRPERRKLFLEVAVSLAERTPFRLLHTLFSCAVQLEQRLYMSASSYEVYADRSTLNSRLKNLARALCTDAKGYAPQRAELSALEQQLQQLTSMSGDTSAGTAGGGSTGSFKVCSYFRAIHNCAVIVPVCSA
jgi:hypothetical protein